MKVIVRLKQDCHYVTEIKGAIAEWANRNDRVSVLTIYGAFPVNGGSSKYILYMDSDIAFSLCKKLEKEGMADLTTDFIRSVIKEERFAK